MRITLSDIFNIDGTVIYNPDNFKSVSSVSIDTRTLKKNSLYVALKGARFDGHKFVDDAISKGASAILVSKRKLKDFDHVSLPIITVSNTTIAYGELAAIWRNKLNAKVVSITGSNGKTTTKEILATMLSERFIVLKSLANNNNHIGVPLTILSAKASTEVLVLEHGTNHFNEIKYTAQIANPDYAVITNIGDSHLEYLVDRGGVFKEKSALFNSANLHGGIVFINNNDEIIRKNSKGLKNKVTYGFTGKCDVKAKILGYTSDGKTKIRITFRNRNLELVLPLYGGANARNVIAAVAIAQHLGLTLKELRKGISNLQQIKGRLFVEDYKNITLIDDTYNSNPSSVKSAIDLVTKIKNRKIKTLILGDMFELGKDSISYHKKIANEIVEDQINNVYTIGKMMNTLDKELKKTKVGSIHFSNRKSLKTFIDKSEFIDEVVLLKGSRGMRMEEFVKQLRSKAA